MLKIEQILRNEEGQDVLGKSFDQIKLKDKFIIVQKQGVYGLYRMHDYKKLLEAEWDEITFKGDFIIAKMFSQIALFDYEGKKILEREWDKIVLYENGILVFKGGQQGFYSYDGKAILDCNWKRIEPYANVMLAYRGNGAKRIMFDYAGNQIQKNTKNV